MSAKAALQQLTAQRAQYEEEMNAIISRLTAPGMPGIKGPLVDNEASSGVPLITLLAAASHSGRTPNC